MYASKWEYIFFSLLQCRNVGFFLFQWNMSQSATSVKPTLLLDLGNLHILVTELQ